MQPKGFAPHDHNHCIDSAVREVERQCREAGLKLTPVRRRVLELLLARHHALGAYDILATLRAEGLGAQPPVAYRALDFLVSHGFAHKIERLNAFIACAAPGRQHRPAFLICRDCRKVAEAPYAPVQTALSGAAGTVGFSIDEAVIEAIGQCPNCAPA
jgi:Fur family zinc uptake transcriptional regulator